jgi:hypothetical protein
MKKLDEMTIAEAREMIPQARELLKMFGDLQGSADNSNSPLPYPVGTPVYVRGAIYSVTGRIQGRNGEWLQLSEAAYIGTDGRFSEATQKGIQNAKDSEVEPVGGDGTIRVNIGATADVTIHPGDLPSKVS